MNHSESQLLSDLLCPENDVDAIVENFVRNNRASHGRDASCVPSEVLGRSPHRALFAPRPDDETQDEGIQTDSVMVKVLHSPPRVDRLPLRPPTPEFVRRTASIDESESYSYSSYTGSDSLTEETLPPNQQTYDMNYGLKSVIPVKPQLQPVAVVPSRDEINFRRQLLQVPEQRRKKTVTVQAPPEPRPKEKTSCFC